MMTTRFGRLPAWLAAIAGSGKLRRAISAIAQQTRLGNTAHLDACKLVMLPRASNAVCGMITPDKGSPAFCQTKSGISRPSRKGTRVWHSDHGEEIAEHSKASGAQGSRLLLRKRASFRRAKGDFGLD